MATIAYSAETHRDEVRFFFVMACVLSATILAGFTLNIVTGRSSFDVPWLVHFHAWAMMSWIGLYLAQNVLVFTGNVALHRRLGWLAVLLIPVVVLMGFQITRWTLLTRGGPPFFGQNEFLFNNPVMLLTFAGTAAWAIALRGNTAWHRRLMFCAVAMLTGPSVGRLVPAVFLIPYAWELTAILPAVLFPAIGMLADKRRYGVVHPAWLWGVAVMLALQIVSQLVAGSAWGVEVTERFLAGSPGAERPMEAFFPPMPPS